MPKKKATKQYKSGAFIVIILFAASLAAAAIIGVSQYSSRSISPTVAIKTPVIRTLLVSGDGREYTVQTQFHVQVDRESRKSVNPKEIEEALTEIMGKMDYDSVASMTGVDYINARATEELNKYLDDTTQARVVVTDFATDDRIQLTEEPTKGTDDLLRGITDSLR